MADETLATVAVVETLEKLFHKRFRKDPKRATQVWRDLVGNAPKLRRDTTYGQAIPRTLWPKQFQHLPNLARLELIHGFRAVYTVEHQIGAELPEVRVEWVGSHKEYDKLFGYSTS